MSPPDEYVQFLVGGSSNPAQTMAYLSSGKANFIGNEAFWLTLPANGEMDGLFDKFLPWRTKAGELKYEARRLDGARTTPKQPVGPSGYGDIGFQAGGVDLPEAGCWEVTYTLNDEYLLRFVVRAGTKHN